MNSTSSISSAAGPAAIKPWQFYMTASFLAAAAAVWLSPPSTPVAMIFISLAIGAAGASAAALHALLKAFAGKAARDVEVSEGERTALEREKLLALRAIKDLQFDAAMGKISAADAALMEARLRERAAAIVGALDSREALRARVEEEIARRQATQEAPGQRPEARGPQQAAACASCGTANDSDARFCKNCGGKL
jgi:hypothetical protein